MRKEAKTPTTTRKCTMSYPHMTTWQCEYGCLGLSACAFCLILSFYVHLFGAFARRLAWRWEEKHDTNLYYKTHLIRLLNFFFVHGNTAHSSVGDPFRSTYLYIYIMYICILCLWFFDGANSWCIKVVFGFATSTSSLFFVHFSRTQSFFLAFFWHIVNSLVLLLCLICISIVIIMMMMVKYWCMMYDMIFGIYCFFEEHK